MVRDIEIVSKRVIWNEASQDMKDFITTMIDEFNARPVRILINNKGWKNTT